MADDDLERLVRSTEGDGPSPDFVAALRAVVVAEAEKKATSADRHEQTEVVDLPSDVEERPMRKMPMIVAGVAAATIALIVGITALADRNDDGGGFQTIDPAEASTTTSPAPATDDQDAGDPGSNPDADADAGCGLSERATVTATVDPSGESVAFEVESDPACAGVEVTISAEPAVQGIPILQNLTLDGTGAATATDQLLGSRQAAQDWDVELIVRDTGGVAARGGFALSAFCDLEGTIDLQASHLPATNEVNIVLTVDPACAGRTFSFDRDNLFVSSPRGGWTTHTVDENGRIEITEQLTDTVEGPFIAIEAIPASNSRFLPSGITIVTLDISG